MFIMNNAIGLVTPPLGVVLNVVAGVGKMSMDTVTKGVMPFMLAQFIIMFAMVLFPWLVTWPRSSSTAACDVLAGRGYTGKDARKSPRKRA
jgi:TRAP-type C4-dicarboxylate transport system permease large subunit